MSIPSCLNDLDAMEREMFDEYNVEQDPFLGEHRTFEELEEDGACNTASEHMLDQFLVQHIVDGELIASIMSAGRLIDYINMSDCHGENYEIFDCTSEIGKVKPLHYKGWQPGGLIEIIDENGATVLRGYGEDH